jgi:hypothetical protein
MAVLIVNNDSPRSRSPLVGRSNTEFGDRRVADIVAAALTSTRGERSPLNPLHETIHHALFAGLVEGNGQLVAVDGGDVAVAEFQVENAVAE